MGDVQVSELRENLAKFLQDAEHGREFTVVSQEGRPVARLGPPPPPRPTGGVKFGLLKGKIEISPDFDDPLPDDILALDRERQYRSLKFLVDTHALLWLMRDDRRVGETMRRMLRDPANEAWASIVSISEIAVKARLGRLPENPDEIAAAMPASGLRMLDLRVKHLVVLRALPVVRQHRDPFDHLLVAQSIAEGFTFVSDDKSLRHYEVSLAPCSGHEA
jgi:PIN domain nuclease of toxin-antitoxin system/antitoxin (DNA-binding transcriptional repressor) of toxin-antitoxin stability system